MVKRSTTAISTLMALVSKIRNETRLFSYVNECAVAVLLGCPESRPLTIVQWTVQWAPDMTTTRTPKSFGQYERLLATSADATSDAHCTIVSASKDAPRFESSTALLLQLQRRRRFLPGPFLSRTGASSTAETAVAAQSGSAPNQRQKGATCARRLLGDNRK